ncbi:MAG: hypothetical protein ACK4VN_02730 [Bacteroidales bacterium]
MEKRISTLTSAVRLPGLFVFVIVFWVAGLLGVHAQTYVAGDQASNYSEWNNGSNQGYGFGPWVIATGGGGFAGAFIGDPGDGEITGLPNPSFGLFANPAGSGAFVNADRNLIYPLPVGATLSFDWGVNWDSNGDGNKGFNLYVGGTQVININQGGTATITINGDNMFTNYDTQAMTMHFERVSATQLRVHATGRNGVETYDNTFTLANSAIDALRFYASGLAGGNQRQPYFNNFRISFPSGYTLTEDVEAAAVEIASGSSLGLGTHQLSIGGAGFTGFLQNNGTLLPGTGTVRFAGAALVSGNPVVFHNLVLHSGVGVNFGAGLSTVQQTFEIRSGFVEENAPVLLEGSTLLYAAGGGYNRAVEWNNPWHVRVGFNTQLNLNLNAWGDNITIAGNLTIDENSGLSVDAGPDPWDFVLAGDLNLNGQLILSESFGRDMQIRGSWNQSFTGSFDPNNREVVFNGTGVQSILGNPGFAFLRMANPGGEVVLHNALTVNNRLEIDSLATLNMQHHVVSGGGAFNLREGGILKIGHPEGISTLPNTGNVQMSGVRTFSAHATYHYTGQSNQFSGNALPTAAAPKTLIVELGEDEHAFRINTGFGIVVTEPGRLEIRSGTVIESTSFAQGRSVSGNGSLVMTGGVFRFERTTVATGNTFPRFTGIYQLSGGVIELAGITDSPSSIQRLRGGENYHGVRIAGTSSGGGYKTHSSAIVVNDVFEITGDNVFDAGSNALAGPASLIMDSGRLRISKLTDTQPELTGDYFLTGGTIELYGTSSSQNQTLRGGKTYHNVEINANAANPFGDGGNVNISSSINVDGTMSVNAPACFQAALNFSVSGPGSFILHNGAWLRYGNAAGITLSADAGNIRTASRSFSPEAGYVLISSSNMVTGNGLPGTVNAFVVQKPNSNQTVTLSSDLNVMNQLVLINGIVKTDDKQLYLLSANPDALIAGTGNLDFKNSFIDGRFRRGVSGPLTEPFVFPVGRENVVMTASVLFTEGPANSGNPISLIAEFVDDLPEDYYGNLPITSHNVFVNTLADVGFWRITAPDDIGGSIYDLELFANGFDNIVFPDLVSIVKRPDGSDEWSQAGAGIIYEGSELAYRFKATEIGSGFSEFAIGSSFQNNPLPVDWLSFSATRQTDEVLLQWQTATEINNHYFTVLRSHNGLDFAPLSQLPGAGNSNQILSYAFADSQPLPGVSYYKIRQTDFDGKTDYSKILAVALPTTLEPALWYQGQTVYIHLPAQSSLFPWSYRFVDLQGRTLHQGQVAGQEGLITLEIPAGNHRIVLFSITQGEQRHTLKIPVSDSRH